MWQRIFSRVQPRIMALDYENGGECRKKTGGFSLRVRGKRWVRLGRFAECSLGSWLIERGGEVQNRERICVGVMGRGDHTAKRPWRNAISWFPAFGRLNVEDLACLAPFFFSLFFSAQCPVLFWLFFFLCVFRVFPFIFPSFIGFLLDSFIGFVFHWFFFFICFLFLWLLLSSDLCSLLDSFNWFFLQYFN